MLRLALQSGKELKSITVRVLANQVTIGLMAATLVEQLGYSGVLTE
jgi:hypothetical protein